MTLITFPNLLRVDDVYQWLVDAHHGLSDEESARFSSRLILMLINHLGDETVIREAIDLAGSASGSQPAACRAAHETCDGQIVDHPERHLVDR